MKRVFCRMLRTLICTIALCTLMMLSVFAEDAKIVEVKSNQDGLLFYVKGIESQIEEADALIGTTECTDVSSSLMSDESFYMNTMILLDNSISIPEKSRSKVKSVLLEMIAGRSDKEKFALALFDEKAEIIQEFTDDYTVLKGKVDEIEFEDQETYLTDVLYDLLSQDAFSGEGDHYDRILVISDGVDNKSIGYTTEELTALVAEKKIPIYTVGVYNAKKSNDEQLKNMFSIARASRAESYLLDDYEDPLKIIEDMSTDHNMAKVAVKPDASMMDGSRKAVTLHLKSGGADLSLTENDVLLAQVAQKDAEVSEPEKTEETVPETEEKKPMPMPMPEPEQPAASSGGVSPLLLILIGVVVVAVIVVVVSILLKRKKEQEQSTGDFNPFAGMNTDEEKTMQLFEEEPSQQSKDDGETLYMWDEGQNFVLTLTDTASPSKSFQKPIKTKLVIGRKADRCDICIDYDRTVSSTHCEIELRNNKFYLRDLGSSNGTFLNDSRVTTEVEIYSGCLIKMGRVEMRAEMS